jgi:hypothetical protein
MSGEKAKAISIRGHPKNLRYAGTMASGGTAGRKLRVTPAAGS